MADCDGKRFNWAAFVTAFMSVVSFGLTAIMAAVVFGNMQGQVQQNSEAIKQLQADNRNSATMLAQINERTARMETKLEILLPTPVLKREDKP